MSEQLDLTPLVNAQRRLGEGLLRYQKDISDTQIRDGLIQRFEFTYEIAQKMLKRYLESTSASPGEYDAMAFGDLIRSANEKELLLGDWKSWKRFREMRGKTSHTYDEEVALQVVSGIAEFLAEAEFLIGQLQRRSAK
jgi:nucleotidyltransferase substrate binding protein (TIGR01987 family)